MKVSDLIAKLQDLLATEGDIGVYTGDMEAPRLELNKTVDPEDIALYGETYLSIEGP